MWGYHDGMGWWFVFGGIWWIGLVAAAIWFVAWTAIRSGRRSRGSAEENPLEIARRRLASGEIGLDEFDQIERAIERRA